MLFDLNYFTKVQQFLTILCGLLLNYYLSVMFFRFPPIAFNAGDPSFLTENGVYFAKLKEESDAGKRTVFLTEHTLIFVTKGIKLLHLPDETIEAGPDSVILLKKGICVMVEYIAEGLNFEALLFLPVKLLKAIEPFFNNKKTAPTRPYMIFPCSELIQGCHHVNGSMSSGSHMLSCW
jgi:hypothetical protein